MKLRDIITDLNLTVSTKNEFDPDLDIVHGYACDLLSQVIASAKADSIWLTVQSHMNVVGVASLKGVKAIVICEGHDISENVIDKADGEGIVLLRSKEGMFPLSGKLCSRGVE